MTRLEPLDLWEQASQDLLAVLRDLGDDDWGRPALPGWTVQDVLAHLAHLESEAAGLPQPDGRGRGARVAVRWARPALEVAN